MVITIKSIQERLAHLRRLELAGVNRPGPEFGLPVILWSRQRDGQESWEVLPALAAQFALSSFREGGEVERAAVYHRIPKNAPMDVAARWLRAKMGNIAFT